MSQTKAQLISDLVQALNFTGTASAPANGLFLSAANTLQLSTASTPRLTINSDGHVDVVGNLDVGAGIDVTGSVNATTDITLASTSSGRSFIVTKNGTQAAKLGHIGTGNEGVLVLNDGGTATVQLNGETGSGNSYINSTNFGIGTATPADKLHVYHASDNAVARFESGDTGVFISIKDNTHTSQVGSTNGAFEINVDNGGDLAASESINFKMSGSSKVFIDSDGRLLVGTTSSASSTAMLQTERANNSTILISNSDATATNFAAVDFAPANSTVGSRIVSKAIGTFGSSAAQTADLFFETIDQGTSEKRLYIDSTGLVGIGTDSPSTLLDVEVGTNDKLEYGSNPRLYLKVPDGTNGLRIDASTTPLEIRNSDANGRSFSFGSGGASNFNMVLSGDYSLSSSGFDSSPTIFLNTTRHNGSTTATSFQCSIQAVATSNANNTGYLGFGSSATPDDLVIKTNGNVGIGTTSPNQNLMVMDAIANEPQIRIETSDGGSKRLDLFVDSSADANISAQQSAQNINIKSRIDTVFIQGGTSAEVEAMRIDSNGKIKIVGTRSGDLQANDDDALQLYTKSSTSDINRGTGITFYTHDGSGFEMGGTIQVAKENGTANDPASYMRFSTQTGSTTEEAVRISSGGNVGIGATDPAATIHVANDDPQFRLQRIGNHSTTSGPLIQFQGRGPNTVNYNFAKIDAVSTGSNNAGHLRFFTNASGTQSEKVRIKSDGDVEINTGNIKFGTAGKGISFSETSDATGKDNELFDDYEEGTWAPILTDDGTSGNSASSYTHQLGWYTKVGNIVNLQCRISGANTTGFNTPHSAFIKNLPFAIKGSSNRLVIGSLMLSNVNLDSDTMGIGILANVGAGSGSDNTFFRLFQTKDNAVWGDIEISQIPSGNHEIQVNFTYRAA